MPIFPAGAEHLTDDATGSQIAGHDAQSTTGQQTATNQSTGSGTAFNIMQPYAVVSRLIKT